MSYEGQEQHLCDMGHLFVLACDYGGPSEQDKNCPICKAPSVWMNQVDDTNGDSYGIIPDSEWAKFLISGEKNERCNLGHHHITRHAIYRLPKKEEKEFARHYWDPSDLEFKRIMDRK